MLEVVLKRFEKPDETRVFEKGRFDIVRIGGITIGRASYDPGWKWSEHVGAAAGESSCQVEHVGLVLSGEAVAKMDDGTEVVRQTFVLAGETIAIAPPSAWLSSGMMISAQPELNVPIRPIMLSLPAYACPFSLHLPESQAPA